LDGELDEELDGELDEERTRCFFHHCTTAPWHHRTSGLAEKLNERLKILIEFENVLMC